MGVDIDALKPYHPRYRAAVIDGVEAHGSILPDCVTWFERALDLVAELRVNAVVEHSLLYRSVMDRRLARFHRAGYRTEIALVAAPAAVSRLGILARYQFAVERIGYGRYCPEDHHDRRFDHLVEVARWADGHPHVSRVSVHRRGEVTPIYSTERGLDGRWQPPPQTPQVLKAERCRPWSADESTGFLDLHRRLVGSMEPRWHHALRNALDAAEPYLATRRPAVRDPSAGVASRVHLEGP